MLVKSIRRYVPVVVVGRGSESGKVSLGVRYEGNCLTGFFKCCVGEVKQHYHQLTFQPSTRT
jgi:hypothetical protein